MSFVKKLKDILFEEEEYTEPIKVKEEVKKVEPPKIVKIEPEVKEEVKKDTEEKVVPSEREMFKKENSFSFPDFDEEEFASSVARVKPKSNVLEYERKKSSEKRTNEYSRLERAESREASDKKKFKPSPIISPVYGILNQDYKASDIIKKSGNANIDIESVRKKAFEKETKEDIKKDIEMELDKIEDTIDEPVVTFFEDKDSNNIEEEKKSIKSDYKSIDDLLEEAADEINLEDTIEIPEINGSDAIEEELDKIEEEEIEDKKDKDLDDTLDNDLYELIDSMYDDREGTE